jgi:hypothetical protein
MGGRRSRFRRVFWHGFAIELNASPVSNVDIWVGSNLPAGTPLIPINKF